MQLTEVVKYLDGYLRTHDVPDYPQAANGLQVENSGQVRRVAVAVDAALGTIERAARAGADLLLVHHGLFWDGEPRVTARRYRRLKALFQADMAVYSAHLPLDVHPEVGNNRLLASALGMSIEGSFGDYRGEPIGVWGTLDLRREALAARLDEVLGRPVRMIPGGPERVRRAGVITGGAASQLHSARAAGLDAFVTGEGAHHHFFDAEEGGINLYLGGHYATETWGIRALGEHLSERLSLPSTFIDYDTGL
jgi:dinuclear metal center YbgI/SA1388 family protein